MARQIISKLLTARVTFTPESRDGRDGFSFQATGTVTKLISGVVPRLQRGYGPPGNRRHANLDFPVVSGGVVLRSSTLTSASAGEAGTAGRRRKLIVTAAFLQE